MMTQVILYRQDNGKAAVVYPTADALARFSLNEIAIASVPFGKSFAYLALEDLPPENERDEWVADERNLTDGIGMQV